MYTTTRHTASVSVEDYLRDYVDVPTFLDCCRACPNYDTIWSCPPYDFDVEDYWKQYETLELLAINLIYDEELCSRSYTQEERQRILDESLQREKAALSRELFALEESHPGSISLSAGSCTLCDGCAKKEGKPCRFPENMRYSIESLGGNVGLTVSKLMGLELEWMEEGRLPSHFVLVSGLLLPAS